MAVNLELLKTACYFSDLERAALEDISDLIYEKKIPAAEFALWEGGKDDSLYFVITGLIKLFSTSADGREFIIRMVYGGDSINDDNIFDSGPGMLSASAVSPVVLYGLRRKDLEKVLTSHPKVYSKVTKVFADRQRYLVSLAKELVFKNVTSRLARLLLEREALVSIGVQAGRLTQQDMASMIGTVRELVSRSLKELEGSGAISLEHNQLVIKDRKRLEDLSSV